MGLRRLGTSVGIGVVLVLGATPPLTATASTGKPKTVFGCKKLFAKGSKSRAACIKRVNSERPGSSCRHPLESGFAADAVSIGDTKDYTVTEKVLSEVPKSVPGPWIVEFNVVIHNPRIIICGIEVDEIVSQPPTFVRVKHVFHPTISPHGGLSSSVEEQEGSLFGARVFARYG